MYICVCIYTFIHTCMLRFTFLMTVSKQFVKILTFVIKVYKRLMLAWLVRM
jgi:hypothetical protein